MNSPMVIDAPKAHSLLGLPLWTAGRAALREHLVGSEELVELHSVNAEISIQVRGDEAYRQLLASNATNIMDGEGVRRILGLKYGQLFERISGSDFTAELCALAADQGWRVFLLGASEEVSAKAATILLERHPGLGLGRFSPPFERDAEGRPSATVSDELTADILARIRATRPHVLLAFLGSPKQELWMKTHEGALLAAGVRIVMGAGGGLDFIAGKVKRAPKLVSSMGLEWAWRLAKQPRARFGRMAGRLPKYLCLALCEAIPYRLGLSRAARADRALRQAHGGSR